MVFLTQSQLGPIIGGFLARPADQFPDLFGNNEFLKTYPYFLPCAVPATFVVFAWIITFFCLKETSPNPIPVAEFLGLRKTGGRGAVLKAEEPIIPLKSLLTYEVVIASANYATLALVEISFRAVHPVFLSTPIEIGGLGLAPPTIGKLLSALGLLNGIFQVCFFARIQDRWGSKRVFIGGLMPSTLAFALFPVINTLARRQGYSPLVWIAVGVQLLLFMVLNCSFGTLILTISSMIFHQHCLGAIFILIAAASPSRASLGATNGLSQVRPGFKSSEER